MTDRPVEPPLTDELPEMIQAAAEIDDPVVYKILDIQIAKRTKAYRERASAIVRMLDDGAA